MSTKAHVTKKARTADTPEATSRPRRTKRTAPTTDRVLPFSQLDPKQKVWYLLDPVYRFERRLHQLGFRITDMNEIKDEKGADAVEGERVWEFRMSCPPKVRCRTSSEIMNRLRTIAEQADCPIAPGMLVAVVSGRKVVASFKAPPVGQPMKH